MIFLGNSASSHLETWVNLYRLRRQEVGSLYSVHPLQGQFRAERRVTLGHKLPSYALLGCMLRFAKGHEPIHAHGASGYGLSALLSGRPYVVTIYGSELLPSRGPAYLRLVRAVLRRARAITVTSRTAMQRVIEICPSVEGKTHCFHTGLDIQKLQRVAALAKAEPEPGPIKLMCIRNCAPNYRTAEVLTALRTIVHDVPDFRLMVALGNGDPAYFTRLRSEFADPWVTYLDGIVPNEAFLARIRDTDICVNFPIADQASATLLEAVFFGKLIVTNRLDAYADILGRTAGYEGWRLIADAADLPGVLARAIRDQAVAPRVSRGDGAAFISQNYGLAAAADGTATLVEALR